MNRLANKVALITGGGSGIGLAATRLFLEEGAKVAITGRDEAKLKEAVARLGGDDRVFHAAADIADPKQVKTLVDKVNARFGRIDILLNNAGVNVKNRAFRKMTPETWQKVIRANLDGAFFCIHYVLPQMIDRRDGLVINIDSVSGKRAHPLGGVAYNASKHGMAALGLCLGAEEKDYGIRVCNIYPGEVDTPILKDRPSEPTPEHRQRMMRPEDVAAAVLFVATLPPHVTVPELIIKPADAVYV
jgi:NAD(P)-dependent dehydrogenase (short-subunit alcohol dehydrogenase family)